MKKITPLTFLLIFASIMTIAMAGDTTPPTITQFDVPSTAYAGQPFTVITSANDNVAMNYLQLITNTSFGTSTYYCLYNPCSKTWTITENNPGTYKIKLKATDTSLNANYMTKYISIIPFSDTTPPTVSVTGVPSNWVNYNVAAGVSCSDNVACDTNSYRIKIYSSNPGTCSNNYNDYVLSSPQTISSHQWVCAAAKDTSGNAGFSNPAEFKVDKNAPQITPTVSPSSPATYQKNQLYTFSATITDESGLLIVLLEFNGLNYTITSPYSKTFNDLPANNYTYKWYAKDNAGNWGYTSRADYIVNRATPSLTFTITPSSPITYGIASVAACSINNNEQIVKLYRNGNDITSENGISITLPAGTWNYYCNVTVSQNYSSAEMGITYVVNKAAVNIDLYLNDAKNSDNTITYPTQANISAIITPSGYLFTIYLNGNSLGAGIFGYMGKLPAGTYNVTAYFAGNGNYSSFSRTNYLTVNRATSSVNLTLTPSSPINYGTPTTAVCTDTNPEANANLYRNGVLANSENNTAVILPANTHNYVCNVTATQNYTDATASASYIVNKATPVIHLALNGNESDIVTIYGSPVNATGWVEKGDLNAIKKLYRDDVERASGSPATEIIVADVNNYVYRYEYESSQNYTSNSITRILTVNPMQVTIRLWLDGEENDKSFYEPASFVVNGLKSIAGTLILYKNGIQVNSTTANDIWLTETNLPTGSYNYTLTLSSTNYFANPVTRIATVQSVPDTTAPQYSNCTVIPSSPTTYSKGSSYIFSCTWTDNKGVDTVNFEFNGKNYTPSKVGNVYSTTLTDLAANETGYPYRWYAKDASNNWNQTNIWNYIINKATSTLNFTINPPSPIVYGTVSTATCSINNNEQTMKLYRNGTDITSENGVPIILPAGVWNYLCNASSTQNYSSVNTGTFYIVNKANPIIHLEIDGIESDKTITYGATTNVTGWVEKGEKDILLPRLVRDAYNIGQGLVVSEIIKLGAGVHNYNYIYYETQNYSTSVISRTLTVNKALATIKLLLNGTESDQTYFEPATYSINASKNVAEGILLIYKNGSLITWPVQYYFDEIDIPAGIYNYTLVLDAENYTASPITRIATVLVSDIEAPRYLNCNITNPTSPTIYSLGQSYEFTCQWEDNVGVTETLLEFNGTNYTASQISPLAWKVILSDLAAGNYIYRWFATDAANNWNSSTLETYVIQKAPTTTNLFLNNQESDITITYGTLSNATAITDFGIVNLYRDGSNVPNPEIEILAAGTYVYLAENPGNENYSSSSVTRTLTIERAISTVTLAITPSSPITYGIASTATCTDTNPEADIILTRDGIDVTSENGVPVVLAAKPSGYLYECNVPQTQNYTGASTSELYIVNKADNPIYLYLNDFVNQNLTITYGAMSNATGVSTAGTANLYRDDVNVSNPEILILDAGIYEYLVNTSENENYTANLTTHYLIVERAPTSIKLYLNGTEGNRTYMQFETANFTVELNVSGKNVYLDSNISGWILQSGLTPLENITQLNEYGIYNITAYFPEDANYIGSSKTYFATVLESPAITILSPENITYDVNIVDLNYTTNIIPSWTGYSLDYGNNITITGNTTLIDLEENRTHYLILYANNSANKFVFDDVYFTIPCLSKIINTTIDGIFYANKIMNLKGVSTITCSILINDTITNSTILRSKITNKELENIYIEDAEWDPYPIIKSGNSTFIDGPFILDYSSFINSTIKKQSNITYSQVWYSNVTHSIINDSFIWYSEIIDSEIYGSQINYSIINSSYVLDSIINGSYIENSTIIRSSIFNSTIKDSTIMDSEIYDSIIIGSFIRDMIVRSAVIIDGYLYSGCVIYGGVEYCAPMDLDDIYNPPTESVPGVGGGILGGGGAITTTGLMQMSLVAPDSFSITQGETKSITAIVTNIGHGDLSRITITASGLFITSVDPTSISKLAPGESETITITLSPKDAEIGTKTTIITATSSEVTAIKGVSVIVNAKPVSPAAVPPVTPTGPTGLIIAVATNPYGIAAIVIIVALAILGFLYFKRKDELLKFFKNLKKYPAKFKNFFKKESKLKTIKKEEPPKEDASKKIEESEEIKESKKTEESEKGKESDEDKEPSAGFTIEYK